MGIGFRGEAIVFTCKKKFLNSIIMFQLNSYRLKTHSLSTYVQCRACRKSHDQINMVCTWEYVGSCLFMAVFMCTCTIRYTAIEFKLCHQPVQEYAMKVSGQQINVAVGELVSCSGT